MLLGAYYAGTAIEQSMLGATHACANPLTARYGTPHGVAIAVMLPHVVRWNAAVVGDRYRELLWAAGVPMQAVRRARRSPSVSVERIRARDCRRRSKTSACLRAISRRSQQTRQAVDRHVQSAAVRCRPRCDSNWLRRGPSARVQPEAASERGLSSSLRA